ncbi:SAM-dependent methyltransferase [Paenibacillus sp. FSL R7-0273]|uniref:class I SAM-dependent methyltransferase n=1 Tax=Paenibacillus sp. FSL R7-0273 TaxID=1536772 RepID=UPI0004F79653|nr:class I SAM-dependent methyltransferase [Paenibacillus sp. FSL R7-0273]AIQ49053.1 SAM-dependent methyltransferase [Paenibacillus sp. FSL R7-0273]OMF90611.1 SAM-dependent methyltransferase [Paenibacillus sp. FSL R7-0273]
MGEWYEKSFGEDYLIVYRHRDFCGARHEVEKMIGWLELPEGSKVLDLCCGMGRHSLALAEAGFEVTGVDLSEVLLREARAQEGAEQVTWLRSDMRELPLDGGFDAVVNLFTSFGYFEEDEEQIKVLREICRMLKPEGKFIIDFLNPSYVIRQLVPHSTREDGDILIDESRRIEDGYVKKDIVLTSKGDDTPRKYHERVKLYPLDAFKQLLAAAGLQLEAVHGSYDEEEYDEEHSKRMIFVGIRP